MKRALAIVLAAGFAVSSYATDARVVVMGRHSAFYRDETSVFKNPADISLYPDMLYGSLGYLPSRAGQGDYTFSDASPMYPFFGGMVSYRFSEEANGPMLSIGAFANRRDYILEKLMSEPLVSTTPGSPGVKLEDPVAKIDLIVGYDLGNGIAVGVGAYGAHQNVKMDDYLISETSVFKGTLGVNWNLEQGLDLEASVNGGRISAIALDAPSGDYTNGKYTGAPRSASQYHKTVADAEYFWRGDVRFFSAVPAINGSFVPQVSLEFLDLAGKSIIDLTGGVGINMNIDRGFFWAGVQGVYTQTDPDKGDATSSIGARFSFGIERNILTDWFLIRVGGSKEVRNVDVGSGKDVRWWENPEHDGSDEDLIGLGFGLNIDNRLRIDFVLTEDMPYTFTNLLSGNKSQIFNRVSATYRF